MTTFGSPHGEALISALVKEKERQDRPFLCLH
jgi:hypothetical protein